MKFRKKPVTVEARQFDGTLECAKELHDWSDNKFRFTAIYADGEPRLERVHVYTLEGLMNVSLNDWIVKGIAGEFYPVKAGIFYDTYEPADG